MRQMGMNDIEIEQVLCMVAAILHMGNIQFNEDDREKGFITDPRACDFPAYLLGFDSQEMHDKLLTHRMETKWGKSNEVINVEVRFRRPASNRFMVASFTCYDLLLSSRP